LRVAPILIALLLGTGATSVSTSAQSQGSRIEAIAASKTIKIAHRLDAAPFAFVANQSEPLGYTVDLCKYVVAALERQLAVGSLKIEWVPVTLHTRFEAVASGKADLECGPTTVTLSRMKLVSFSNHVFVESTGLVARTAVIKNLRDVSGKKIAVVAGTTNDTAIALQNQKRQLNAIIVRMKNRGEAVAALDSGQVDALVSDKTILVALKFKEPQQLRLLPDDLSIEPYAIVVPRGDWELQLAVNTALAELYRTGEVREIFNRWFLQFGLQPGTLLSSTYILNARPE
jgi:ABC-type amino acid transport substrate-binding protein